MSWLEPVRRLEFVEGSELLPGRRCSWLSRSCSLLLFYMVQSKHAFKLDMLTSPTSVSSPAKVITSLTGVHWITWDTTHFWCVQAHRITTFRRKFTVRHCGPRGPTPHPSTRSVPHRGDFHGISLSLHQILSLEYSSPSTLLTFVACGTLGQGTHNRLPS